MNKVFKVVALCVASVFVLSGTPYAEVVDVTVPITIGATIGAVAILTVTPRNIADNLVAAGLAFTNPGVTPWTVSDQYLQVVYNSNLALWAVRLVTNNRILFPGMAPRPLGAGADGIFGTPDDVVSYGGLIEPGSINNPDNRANLAWQVYAAPQVPGALSDATVSGAWDADWAYVVDVGNTGYDPEVDSDNDVNTLAYTSIIQGGPGNNGLNFHPATRVGGILQPRPGDGDVDVYLGARFQGLGAGNYSANMVVQLIHE